MLYLVTYHANGVDFHEAIPTHIIVFNSLIPWFCFTSISILCLELMASFSSSPFLLLNLDSGPSSSLSKYVPKINLCRCCGILALL